MRELKEVFPGDDLIGFILIPYETGNSELAEFHEDIGKTELTREPA